MALRVGKRHGHHVDMRCSSLTQHGGEGGKKESQADSGVCLRLHLCVCVCV